MIDTCEGKILTAISSAQIIRNLNNTYLIGQAHKLPYCKRNILLTMIIFWDNIYTEIIELLMKKDLESSKVWNVKSCCLKYLTEHNLSNPFFAEFFFNFHQPLTLAFIRRIKRELNNGLPYIDKFKLVAEELTELLNIAYIELDGLDISCESFGGVPLCPSYLDHGKNDCVEANGVFFVLMNEEYIMEKGLFEKILDVALSYLKKANDKVLMVVDYKNMHGTNYIFGPNARNRYEKCMEVVEQVYFYNCDGIISFASENNDLVKFAIPDKKSLKSLIKTWKDSKEF